MRFTTIVVFRRQRVNPYGHWDRHMPSIYRAEGRLQVVSANVNKETSNTDISHESTGQEINWTRDDTMFIYNKNISNNSYKCSKFFKEWSESLRNLVQKRNCKTERYKSSLKIFFCKEMGFHSKTVTFCFIFHTI